MPAERAAGMVPAQEGPSSTHLETCAEQIPDPVERLRYLRQYHRPGEFRQATRSWRWILGTLAALLACSQAADLTMRESTTTLIPVHAAAAPALPPVSVWTVEETKDYEVFSNGLRVEDSLQVANEPRIYRLISRANPGEQGPERSVPAGIVFHTTESDLAPFERDDNRRLQRIGQQLLLAVRAKRNYHFVIDRFGRVHRIVRESDMANHAGHSAWADSKWLYVRLNESFLGIAFEAQTQGVDETINEAQLHAGKTLVEMLRDKYNIPAENCVTHAQVSVNPANDIIGWHTDWGHGFPFAEMGLPDSYQTPSPLIEQFGFEYDAAYLKATGPELQAGLQLAEQNLRAAAARNGSTFVKYRKLLQSRYREFSEAAMRLQPEEN
jgi:hypothetical protein